MTDRSSPPSGPSSRIGPAADRRARWLAYLELVRLPNVFTAVADVAMGFLVTHASLGPLAVFVPLVAASTMLYLGGIVLNDVYDIEIDRRERPMRPLPSQRITLAAATRLGYGLLGGGIVCGLLAAACAGTIVPGVVAAALGGCVLLYDRWMKHMWLGPVAMGSCRGLNVLLGMSAAGIGWQPLWGVIALGIAVYIAGVTWYARSEAAASSRFALGGATFVLLLGIALLAWMPRWADEGLPELFQPVYARGSSWQWFMAILAALIGYRCLLGVVRPVPVVVQRAVKQAILSLIVLDAAVCFAFRGVGWAVAILLLLLPAMFLGRWIYST